MEFLEIKNYSLNCTQ